MWTLMFSANILVIILATPITKSLLPNEDINNQLEIKLKSKMEIIEKKAEKMHGRDDAKLKTFGESIKEFKTDLNKADGPTYADKVGGAIESVGGGAITLYKGIAEKKWQDIIVGTLGIIGGFAAFAGPFGTVLASVMKVMSSLFGLISNDQKAEESQESILERVINEALDKARLEDLKADAEGLKRVVLSVRNSINQFRELKNISKNEAYEMYSQVFRGLDFLGRLKYEIDKFCKCPTNLEFDAYGKEYEKEEYNKKHTKATKEASKCLSLLNLYSDISIFRQLLIADMASLFFTVDLQETGENLLSFGKKERLSDLNILVFLYDPINNHDKRFCITQYFAAPSRFPTIMPYIAEIKALPGVKFPSYNIVVCSHKELGGVCNKFDIKKDTKSITWEESEWPKSAKSIYISDHLKVVKQYSWDPKTSNEYYYGPTVIGTKIDFTVSINSIIYVKHTKDEDANKMVRVCKNTDMGQNNLCQQVKIDEKLTVKDFGIKSMWIPEEAQVEFELKNDKNPSLLSKLGPFYGPNLIDDFCQEDLVESMTVLKNTQEVSKMVKVCRGLSFSTQCEYLIPKNYNRMCIHECRYWHHQRMKSMVVPEDLMVEMWTEDDFKGLKMGPYIGPLSLPSIEGVNSDTYILSMKVCEKSKLKC